MRKGFHVIIKQCHMDLLKTYQMEESVVIIAVEGLKNKLLNFPHIFPECGSKLDEEL